MAHDQAWQSGQPGEAGAHKPQFYAYGRTPDGRYRFSDDDLPQGVSLIGEGEIGGKARGLLFVMDHVARGNDLTQHQHLVCFPSSTVLTTEIFDEFVAENALDDVIRAGCRNELSLDEVADRFAAATFPQRWLAPLTDLLEREKRPLVVRSSSLMEDNPDHSFAGIYLSEFLPNRGPLDKRLAELVASIQRVYASTFGRNARAYRKRHHLNWEEEGMAVLVQNMIGSSYSHGWFYPLVGGVAFSRNFYPWSSRLSPEDGIVRLVVGTGTRAVGREYARVFSPRLPGLRPEGIDAAAIVRYSQETVDVLDVTGAGLVQRQLNQLDNPLLTKICSIVDGDGTVSEPFAPVAMLSGEQRLVASFSRLIEGVSLMPFSQLIRQLLAGLEKLFELPVDVEFALDFSSPLASEAGSPLFFLLQARPLGGRPEHSRITIPNASEEKILLDCHQVLGNGVCKGVKHLVIVDPAAYRWDQAHSIARTVGKINDEIDDEPYLLIGPGRWASSNPQLGVPVQYGEISGATAIVEMATEAFAPELSYGTHFYADMVASGVLYLPFHEAAGDAFHKELLARAVAEYEDEYVAHYVFENGINVFVDGATGRGSVQLSD